MLEDEKNSMTQTAWACVVYSMVPYLGILFIPFAVIAGGLGILSARRRPEIGGERLAAWSFAATAATLAVQLFLWWLLFFVPTINTGGNFKLN